jgi:hypothetical protein
MGRVGELLVVAGQLAADVEALLVRGHPLQQGFLGELGASRLHRKVRLPQGHDRLTGVAVHHHQVAGVAGEVEVLHIAACPRAERDHFPPFQKMV